MSTLRVRATPRVSSGIARSMRPKVASGGEVEEEVNVALGLGGAAGMGADEGDPAHALGRELARAARQDALEFCHEVGITRPGHEASVHRCSMTALCHEMPEAEPPKPQPAPAAKFRRGPGDDHHPLASSPGA